MNNRVYFFHLGINYSCRCYIHMCLPIYTYKIYVIYKSHIYMPICEIFTYSYIIYLMLLCIVLYQDFVTEHIVILI